jgi:ABC-type polysaccharide/polyol phosphate export permease
MTTLTELRESKELLVNLTMREVRGKYKRTVLGQGWSLLNPIALLAIFTLVFGVLLKASPPPGDPSGLDVFALWLAAGLLPWTFFSGALSSGMQSLLVNANLVKKVYFPRELLVSSTVLSFVVTFAVELGVLVLLLLLFGAQPLPWLPLVAVAVLLLTIFTFGLALILSISNVYFRDTSYLIALVLQFWFYLTPIVYPPTLVDQAVEARGGLSMFGVQVPVDHLYGLNPMERFVGLFRALLYDNRFPDWQDWVGAGLSTLLALVIGVLVFRRFAPRLVEEL